MAVGVLYLLMKLGVKLAGLHIELLKRQ